MSLVKLLFGERKPENEGFSKSYETSFSQGNSAVHQNSGTILSVQYDVDSEFFINPEQNIVYMVGNVNNRRVSVPDSEEAEVPSDGTALPVNITPFKTSNIPTGKHSLILFKRGYNLASEQFEIRPNQITRLNVNLTPQESNVGY